VAGEDELGRELDRLFEVPPGAFTAARDDTAKRLCAEGRRELADEIKRLRKPSTVVWLANRLAHERALDVKRLLKAGEALAQRQAEAAGGPSAARFAEARREEQHALQRLAEAARELAQRESVGTAALDRVVQTLRAASLTPEGRELLTRGRLTEELEPPGFEALTGEPPVPARGRKNAKASRGEQAERRRALGTARARVKELRAEERELGVAARRAHEAAERAEAEAAKARKLAQESAARVEAAVETRAEAEAELRRLE